MPEGLQVAAPPDASQLEYTPDNLKVRQALDGRYIFFKWGVHFLGCIGKLTANTDGRRKKINGECPNFYPTSGSTRLTRKS